MWWNIDSYWEVSNNTLLFALLSVVFFVLWVISQFFTPEDGYLLAAAVSLILAEVFYFIREKQLKEL